MGSFFFTQWFTVYTADKPVEFFTVEIITVVVVVVEILVCVVLDRTDLKVF